MTLPRACFLFQGLSEQQIKALDAIAIAKTVKQDQWLFREGESALAFYVLLNGAVELVARVDKGFDLPIQMLRSGGDCCGIAALLSPYVYNIAARCAKQAQVLVLKKEDLESLFQQDKQLNLAIMSNMSRHLLDRLHETRRELRIHFKTLSDSADII